MKIPDEKKPDVLLAVLQERYTASHNMRSRSMQFTLWISGLALGLAWLLIRESPLSCSQCWALTGLITVLFAGTLYFILALRRGFQNNRQAVISAERALAMYEPGVYLEDTTLLPKEYTTAKPKWSDHFCSLCLWILLLGISLLILTWTSGFCATVRNTETTSLQTKGGK